MAQLNLTGGARIGRVNATWPFASLKVTKERLELNATVAGNLVFQPEDIVSIEPYYMIPLIGQGIKITHRIPKYKAKVIFWTFSNPYVVIRQIRETGFLDTSSGGISPRDAEIIAARQKQGGFPVKTSFAVAVVVLWNVLFFIDFFRFATGDANGFPIGEGAITALGVVFLSSLLMLVSKGFRKLALKEGRELKDIGKFLYLIMFISGFLMFAVLMMTVMQSVDG